MRKLWVGGKFLGGLTGVVGVVGGREVVGWG